MDTYIPGERPAATAVSITGPQQDVARPRLSERERQVVQLVLAGCSNQETADRLNLRLQTIKNHLSRIYAKLGVSTRVQLAVLAMRNDLF